MKKIFLALIIMAMSCSCSFGAENEDEKYVRKDLFESHTKNIDFKFDQIFERLDRINAKLEKIEQEVANLNVRMTKVETRVDGLEKRFDDLRIVLRIAFIVLIGLIFGLAVVQRCRKERRENNLKFFTLDDVEKLIDKKFEAKMKGRSTNAI